MFADTVNEVSKFAYALSPPTRDLNAPPIPSSIYNS